jgi:molecular chaperone DnaK (HSP70)
MSPTAAAAPQCVGIDVGTHAACIAVAQGRYVRFVLCAHVFCLPTPPKTKHPLYFFSPTHTHPSIPKTKTQTTKNSGADVLLNAESSRETPALVSYGARQRYAGVHAEARAAMHPAETVAGFKRLLARGAGDEGVGAEVARLPFKVRTGLGEYSRRQKAAGGRRWFVFVFVKNRFFQTFETSKINNNKGRRGGGRRPR